ncbi:glycoside hydrolase family 16 protein [Lyophyllum atratum]|nr:glycoside hydrolase family 16 protein [Lyophyllum atratum]
MSHTPRPRRGAQKALPQEYAAVPQSPRSGANPPSASAYTSRTQPPRTSSVSSHQQNLQTGRGAIAAGVATGAIGGGYGPYSYHPDNGRDAGVYNAARFSSSPSEQSMLPGPEKGPVQNSSTVPQYLWDKDPDLDDALHNPEIRGRDDNSFTLFSARGWMNAGALVVLGVGLITLFAGYPIIWHYTHLPSKITGFNLGGINGTGQIPDLPGLPKLVDPDTPSSAYTRTGSDGKKYNLVYSDEFNVDGRTFYPGDDPFWEAADLHYWPTGDLEWYDPSAITTQDGKLVITLTEETINDLNFKSGMMTSWNKLCFNTGYVEVSVSLPGSPKVPGLWPGVWSMGNLGRAGYGATTEGMWPYSYDTCDLGTFPNQTTQDGVPAAAATGSPGDGPLSFLPGQRLSACTCPGSDHPGPRVSDGRGVPEIDILEAQIDMDVFQGQVSQSFQCAPYNYKYNYVDSSPATTVFDSSKTALNTYKGGVFQQAVSAVTYTEDQNYNGQGYATYAYEWWFNKAQRQQGYIAWYSTGVQSWTITSATIGPDSTSQISGRLIPEEPMYLVLNLGMAPGFQKQDFKNLKFPSKMYIDYVRIYQRQGTKNGITCDPPSHPTSKYIEKHIQAYTNPNLTTWAQAGNTFPRNSLYHGC